MEIPAHPLDVGKGGLRASSEIMVLENNSTDDTAAVARSCAAARVRRGRIIKSYGES
jgi:hypothetical protein